MVPFSNDSIIVHFEDETFTFFRYKKGPMNLRCANVEIPSMDRYWAEQIVAFMILEKYLKEDFHFTAYNTISYIRKGPNVPKKESYILFHGARVLKLPECDAVWGSDTTPEENGTENNKTPRSTTQPEKRRKKSAGSKESSAKRTKTKPSRSSSKSTKRDNQGTPSSTTTSSSTPKKLGNQSVVKMSPKATATSNKSEKVTKHSGVLDASKRLLEREQIIKLNKVETPRGISTDDVIYIPEEENVIEILDEDD